MAARGALCECQGQASLLNVDDSELELRACLHCGARTPPGKWRCVECQAKRDTASAMATMRAARAEASRDRWGESA